VVDVTPAQADIIQFAVGQGRQVPDLRALSPLPCDLAVLHVQSKLGQNMSPMHGAHGFVHDFVTILKGLTAQCRIHAPTRRDLQVQHHP
jgi:hypothetical protein